MWPLSGRADPTGLEVSAAFLFLFSAPYKSRLKVMRCLGQTLQCFDSAQPFFTVQKQLFKYWGCLL